jgi:hypothetical protein
MGLAGDTMASDWWETIKVKGDFRYRHDMIKQDETDARHRQRIRVRLGIFGEVSDYTKVGIQLATGSDDPVSTNQTLDGGFSTKSVGLDLAYFEATHPKLAGVTLTGGKFKNPFFKPGKSELIWDSDWNPEGGVVSFDHKADNLTLTLTGAGLWIDERSSGDDSYMLTGQAVGKFAFNDSNSAVAFGGSMFNYVNAQGFTPFFDPEEDMGNSVISFTHLEIVDTDTSVALDSIHYATGFELLEVFGEFSHKFDKTPITVMGDFVTNTAADSLNTGWLVGVRVGKAGKPGSWEFRYLYRNVEQDAVVGTFTDSDFRGGGTDARGHEFGGAIQLAVNTAFKVTYFVNEIDIEADNQKDFNRLMVDLQLKF